MRLIDADALNYVRVRIYHDDETIGGYNAIVPSSEIKNAPTVDAVPVTRCCDCDNYMHWECPIEQAGYRPMGDMYCAWAERKEKRGEENGK